MLPTSLVLALVIFLSIPFNPEYWKGVKLPTLNAKSRQITLKTFNSHMGIHLVDPAIVRGDYTLPCRTTAFQAGRMTFRREGCLTQTGTCPANCFFISSFFISSFFISSFFISSSSFIWNFFIFSFRSGNNLSPTGHLAFCFKSYCKTC